MTRPALLATCLAVSSTLCPAAIPATSAVITVAPVLQEAPESVPDKPVAVVGDWAFDRAEFGLWLVDQSGFDYVFTYVAERMAHKEAEERGLLPTDEEVRIAFEKELDLILRQHYHGDMSKYERDIVMREQDPAAHADRRRQQLKADLTMAALARADRVVTEDQVDRRFRDMFGPLAERTSLDVAFFNMYREMKPGVRPVLQALKDEALGRAEAASATLRNGKPFAELGELSDKVNSDFVDGNGRVSMYTRRLLGKEVELALANLDEPGDVTAPIAVFDGYFVVQLVSSVPVKKEAMREEILINIRTSEPNSSELAVVRQRLLDHPDVRILLR